MHFPTVEVEGKRPFSFIPSRLGDKDFVDMLVEHARQAAEWHVSAVFCPPIATFRDH